MFSLKSLEKSLYSAELLGIGPKRKGFKASIQQDVWFPVPLVVTVGIHKLIFGPRLKALTGFLKSDRCSHAVPKNADKEVGTARLHHMAIDDDLWSLAYLCRGTLLVGQWS